MYCLSVRQPWASAIFEEKKVIENRTWNTDYRGILVIHSTKLYDATFEESAEYTNCRIRKSFVERVEKKELTVSAVLGVVELYDVIVDSSNSWARAGCFHFKIRNPRLLSKPIKATGRQGLWPPSDALRRAILREL